MEPRGVPRLLGVLGVESAVRAVAVKEVMSQLPAFGISPVELVWETLASEPVTNWPRCDVLLLFPSGVVNLEKVKEYVELTRCSELNTVSGCELLRDRAAMYRRCEKFGIPIPAWVESVDPEALVEEVDRVIVKGRTIDKPFVEKPVDADDHSVYIYFPQSAGGGHMRIDRKHKVFQNVSTVRRDGKYVYQKFVASEGFETKLYAIGGEYVHAEAVPSRMADAQGTHGQGEGHPVPIYLRPREKIIPLRVGLAFGLTVFKAHILRTPTPLSNPNTPGKLSSTPTGAGHLASHAQQPRSSILFDISVGRSSFAKQDKDYFIDSASALATEILKRSKLSSAEGTRAAPLLLVNPSPPKRVSMTVDFRAEAKISSDVQSIKEAMRTLKSQTSSLQIATVPEAVPVSAGLGDWELRCVVALVRHGDRTCKQKLTVKFDGFPPEDVAQLRPEEGGEDFRQTTDLERIAQLIAKYKEQRKSEASVVQHALEILSQRITNSSTISGTPGALDNLKAKIDASLGANKTSWTIKLKWGGDLTPVGMSQAETAGRFFRKTIYDKKDNILHMHASLHHDLKVYASEDRRCQQTAASFAKGLLELSMQLPVIQTGFVRSDGLGRLDDTPFRHSEQVERTRIDLAFLLFGPDRGASLARRLALSTGAAEVLAGVEAEFGSFAEAYSRLDEEVCALVKLLGFVEEGARLYGKETVVLLRNRWYELKKHLDMLRPKEPCPGKLSVIGDIFDNAVYDSRHNLAFLSDTNERVGERLRAVRTLVRKLYSIVTPCEYGLEAEHKAVIGATFIHPLVRKFRWDMRVASGADLGDEEEHLVRYAELYKAIGIENQVRTRLYFAHHSHMLSFLNVLRFGFLRGELDMVAENAEWLNSKVTHLGYLSQIIMQLYEAAGEWQLRILLMPGDDFNSPHGSIAFANTQKLIFTCQGSLETIDHLFTSMLNIVALPITPTSTSPHHRPLSPEDPRFL